MRNMNKGRDGIYKAKGQGLWSWITNKRRAHLWFNIVCIVLVLFLSLVCYWVLIFLAFWLVQWLVSKIFG